MYKTSKNTARYMNESLKLSYDMIFEKSMLPDEADANATPEPEIYTPEELEQRLQERDRQWEERLEKARAEAKEEGFKQGARAGKAEAAAEFETQLASIQAMMKTIDNQFNESLEKLKPHMASLVFEMTEKVLDVPFIHPKIHQRVHEEVLQLVEKLDEELHIKVSVAEEDYEIIQKAITENKNMDHFTLRINEKHNPGEYEVETKKETIIKNFKKMITDFKESVSFAESSALNLEP